MIVISIVIVYIGFIANTLPFVVMVGIVIIVNILPFTVIEVGIAVINGTIIIV